MRGKADRWLGPGLFVFSLLVFLWGIGEPAVQYYDEPTYVSAARALFRSGTNENWAHPLLAKELIAIGMGIFGDRPFGWRIMSAIFGALSLAGMYAWAHSLLRSRRWALYVAALCLLNQLLFVQSRVAMLDIFMFAFLVWGLAAHSAYRNARPTDAPRSLRMLVGGAVCTGLAIACKWPAVSIWFLILFSLARERFLPGTSAWKEKTFRPLVLFFAVPILVYFLTFVPWLVAGKFQPPVAAKAGPVAAGPSSPASSAAPGLSFWELGALQLKMMGVIGGFEKADRKMQSSWTSWPLGLKPDWYYAERESYEFRFGAQAPARHFRGVILLGNPAIMIAGVLALLFCLGIGLGSGTGSGTAVHLLGIYWALIVPWVFFPYRASFYFHYFPPGMILAVAIAFALKTAQERGGRAGKWVPRMSLGLVIMATVIFIHFLPLLTGRSLPESQFLDRIWMQGWTPPRAEDL